MKSKFLNLAAIIVFVALLVSCKQNIEELKKEIMQVDIEFSNLSVKVGMEKAFLEYIDTNGVILKDKSMPIVGKNELIKIYETKSDSGFTLQWKPLFADVASSGEMGYTYGIWTLTIDTAVYQGTYTTFWKKDKKGNWKFVLDTGNDGLK